MKLAAHRALRCQLDQKKTAFFLRAIILLSDNIFRHDFFFAFQRGGKGGPNPMQENLHERIKRQTQKGIICAGKKPCGRLGTIPAWSHLTFRELESC